MLDKLLIGLMILILPVTIGLSWYFWGQAEVDPETQARMEKLDSLIAQLNQEAAQPASEAGVNEPKIDVTTVFYATESGELTVTGVAPETKLNMYLTAVESGGVADADEESTESAVLGKSLVNQVVKVGVGGVFVVNYEAESVEGKRVELRLEQGQASKTVVYDFDEGSFEQY